LPASIPKNELSLVVVFDPADVPKKALPFPVVLNKPAPAPKNVLYEPVVFF
jgi:hypothetical protein